ncbi:hypothetical protein BV22DRAFT_1107116 [Leucogyrophana mollusca]|uniref:Uncharacterized protein n=1 Tax=Leucogyrophana mollusca TaxID=85980 RepID=A0ACB8B716_9AGAM|nr:hypothetical protein BV22DRAFT_1107116 [Leucogyrophana mollusca]
MCLLNTSILQLEQLREPPSTLSCPTVWAKRSDFSRHQQTPRSEFERIHENRVYGGQALADGYDYAINSCYEDAAVCCAYLADLLSNENSVDEDPGFRNSRYIKRGWTLQEVIAPERVEFLAMNWVKIGTKATEVSVIAAVTGVDENSVTKKMSWVSWRETARVEGRADSLMGILGVHMPLLSGEGENAFIRLQREIMRTSNDQTIFSWGLDSRGLSCSSTSDFCDCVEVD